MYYELDDSDLEIMTKAINITGTHYDKIGDLYPIESLITTIDDLIYEIHRLEEKIEDMGKEDNK